MAADTGRADQWEIRSTACQAGRDTEAGRERDTDTGHTHSSGSVHTAGDLAGIISPIFDPYFSDSSYGFRPRRGSHDAVKAAREHVEAGYRYVVDIDLEKFFDRVNHDVLMARVARRVRDKQHFSD